VTYITADLSPPRLITIFKKVIMLLRRNINAGASPGGSPDDNSNGKGGGSSSRFSSRPASSPPSWPGRHSAAASKPRHEGGGTRICNTWILLLIAAVLTTLTYLFPEGTEPVTVEGVEREAAHLAQRVREAEQELEREMYELFQREEHGAKMPQVPDYEVNDATRRMLGQPSKWVDGEKELKKKLKVLAERQSRGLDLGVPVLTRHIEGLPAWPDGTISEDEWKQKVADAYAEMRKADREWQARAAAVVEQNKDRG